MSASASEQDLAALQGIWKQVAFEEDGNLDAIAVVVALWLPHRGLPAHLGTFREQSLFRARERRKLGDASASRNFGQLLLLKEHLRLVQPTPLPHTHRTIVYWTDSSGVTDTGEEILKQATAPMRARHCPPSINSKATILSSSRPMSMRPDRREYSDIDMACQIGGIAEYTMNGTFLRRHQAVRAGSLGSSRF